MSLKNAGHGYDVAYAYWIRLNRPWGWDPDGDGRLCELAYGSA